MKVRSETGKIVVTLSVPQLLVAGTNQGEHVYNVPCQMQSRRPRNEWNTPVKFFMVASRSYKSNHKEDILVDLDSRQTLDIHANENRVCRICIFSFFQTHHFDSQIDQCDKRDLRHLEKVNMEDFASKLIAVCQSFCRYKQTPSNRLRVDAKTYTTQGTQTCETSSDMFMESRTVSKLSSLSKRKSIQTQTRTYVWGSQPTPSSCCRASAPNSQRPTPTTPTTAAAPTARAAARVVIITCPSV